MRFTENQLSQLQAAIQKSHTDGSFALYVRHVREYQNRIIIGMVMVGMCVTGLLWGVSRLVPRGTGNALDTTLALASGISPYIWIIALLGFGIFAFFFTFRMFVDLERWTRAGHQAKAARFIEEITNLDVQLSPKDTVELLRATEFNQF